MKTPHQPLAKIALHSSGLGVPSPATVQRRAQELARINGHPAVTREDWQQAKREVHGGHGELNGDGEDDMEISVSERDMVAMESGHRAPRFNDDSENAVEELFAEGLDEAAHDQMLAARRQAADEE